MTTKDKTFFVNLKKEDTKLLRTKLNWILDELESRVYKADDLVESHQIKAITKPHKVEMTKAEIIENIKRWKGNSHLKIHMCLTYLMKNGYQVKKSDFLRYCKEDLKINHSDLFLLSLTKIPYIREWMNIHGDKRKASDYGNVLRVKEGMVVLNNHYAKEIVEIWEDEK